VIVGGFVLNVSALSDARFGAVVEAGGMLFARSIKSPLRTTVTR